MLTSGLVFICVGFLFVLALLILNMVFNFTYKLNVCSGCQRVVCWLWSICISTSVSLLFGLILATLYWISFLVLYLRLIFMELYVNPEVQCYPDSDTRRERKGEAVWNCCCWLYGVLIFLNIGYDEQYMHLMFTQILTIPAFSTRYYTNSVKYERNAPAALRTTVKILVLLCTSMGSPVIPPFVFSRIPCFSAFRWRFKPLF